MGTARLSTQTLFYSLISVFTGIITGIIVARVLGPAGKGQAAVAVAAPVVLAFMGNLGIPSAVVYHISQKNADQKAFFASVTVLNLALGLVVVALVWTMRAPIMATILKGLDARTLQLSLLGVPLAFLFLAYSALLQGRSFVWEFNKTQITQTVSSLLLSILFVVVLRWGVFGAVLAVLISMLIRTVESAIYIRAKIGISRRVRWSICRSLLAFGWQVHLGSAISTLNTKLDLFILNALAGNSAVGIFSLAVSFAEMMHQIPEAMRVVIHPRLVADREYANRATPRACRQMLLIGAVSGAIAIALSKPVIRLLYGARFVPAVVPFAVLVPGVIAMGITRLLFADLQARGKPILTAYGMALGLAPHVALDLLLIPIIGPAGAAAAASISYLIVTAYCAAVFSRLSGVPALDLVRLRMADLKVYRDALARFREKHGPS